MWVTDEEITDEQGAMALGASLTDAGPAPPSPRKGVPSGRPLVFINDQADLLRQSVDGFGDLLPVELTPAHAFAQEIGMGGGRLLRFSGLMSAPVIGQDEYQFAGSGSDLIDQFRREGLCLGAAYFYLQIFKPRRDLLKEPGQTVVTGGVRHKFARRDRSMPETPGITFG